MTSQSCKFTEYVVILQKMNLLYINISLAICIVLCSAEGKFRNTFYEGCESPQNKGDGQCDDNNNNENCEYDGGDCCGSFVDKSYCTFCQCLDPNYFKNNIGNVDQMTLE